MNSRTALRVSVHSQPRNEACDPSSDSLPRLRNIDTNTFWTTSAASWACNPQVRAQRYTSGPYNRDSVRHASGSCRRACWIRLRDVDGLTEREGTAIQLILREVASGERPTGRIVESPINDNRIGWGDVPLQIFFDLGAARKGRLC